MDGIVTFRGWRYLISLDLRLLSLFFEYRPEKKQAALPNGRDQHVIVNIQFDALPRRPITLVHPASIVMNARHSAAAPEDMQDVLVDLPLPGNGGDTEAGDLTHVIQILVKGAIGCGLVHLSLQQITFHILKQLGLAPAEIRPQEIFRVDEPLARHFPLPIMPHPGPLFGILGGKFDRL